MNAQRIARTAAAVALGVVLGAVSAIVVLHRDRVPQPIMSTLDIGFVQDMTAHHQQAVTMTDMLAGDVSAPVKALGEQIRFTQLAEIGQMTGWLQLVGAAPNSAHPMGWMTSEGGRDADAHSMDSMTMPGMATPAELARLQHSSGRDNESQFLQLMIRHHQGGITMAGYAFQHTCTDAVRRAAGIMVAEQTDDIQAMSILLDAPGAGR
ncbi:DUF305 domain-containing protein [Mycolicibacterium sp. P1-5]|uniref:DUF305 domain-containing protein n=1 Tax=Mycolicibacterium sp. P1-5 TaxID=2024617 RepID=UPI0011EE61E5|nr:DUF305 domain-containing protein [Mycolicibacterium sp. P1-5]KAA0107723.1 DUF305 domain-containing protein [Mycolicibacterium sp. P1-5]